MRIVYLLETAAELWGGVKSALEDCNALAARGHVVRVLAKSDAPAWMALTCAFTRVADFARVPDADVVVGTFWTTVPFALQSGAGAAVHYCQGFEGAPAESGALAARIDAVYALPTHKITIAPHLARLLRERFVQPVREIPYAIDHVVMRPGPRRPTSGRRVRVGLVGPWQIAWKDIRTGVEACALAHRAGLDLQLVRVTNTALADDERRFDVPIEVHERVAPAAMGEIYRSLDVMLCTSRGAEEGFFLPAVEAMACGVPCVMTDIPCFRGYGSAPYALFVPPADAAAMAEALVVAGKREDVASALRAHGLATAAGFTRDRHVDALERALVEIAHEAAVPR